MTSPCILTTHCRTHFGHGQIRIKGVLHAHHRVAYCKAHGLQLEEIKGKVVRHTCDNPACVNPEHLLLGTMKDNTQDMMTRGRNRYKEQKGEQIGNHKLTEEDVRAIRSSKSSQVQLAKEYGVTQANISSILLRKTWKHI